MAGDAAVDPGFIADALQLPMPELALGLVRFADDGARGLRQRAVLAEALHLGFLDQGLDVGVLLDQGLMVATGVAMSQPWRSR